MPPPPTHWVIRVPPKSPPTPRVRSIIDVIVTVTMATVSCFRCDWFFK